MGKSSESSRLCRWARALVSGRGGNGSPLAAATSRSPVARVAPAISPIASEISVAMARESVWKWKDAGVGGDESSMKRCFFSVLYSIREVIGHVRTGV
jgi:hypothetical protein